jgi:hypothetical protein
VNFDSGKLQFYIRHRGFNSLVYRQLSANFLVVKTILFAHTTFLWATCCLICFIPIVKPFSTLIFTTVRAVWKYGSRRVWPIDRGCLLLLSTWSPLWYIQMSVYAHSLICISYRTCEIDYCSLFMLFHVHAEWSFREKKIKEGPCCIALDFVLWLCLIFNFAMLYNMFSTHEHAVSSKHLAVVYSFTSRSRIFHLYGDVTIAGEELQNLGLCSALRTFE